MCLFFKLGIGPCFYLIRMQRKDLNETGSRLSTAMYFMEVYFMEVVNYAGWSWWSICNIFVFNKIKVEILSPYKKDTS